MERNTIKEITSILSNYLQGKEKAIELTLITFFSKGHLLIEDLPGLGKTTLAIGIAKVLGLDYGRVQATSDLLPSDIIGVSVFNKEKSQFEFKPGPIFNNILLVDEINRATPKTQSALLEAMGEKQVTVDGTTYKLPEPFFVIATQNPSEQYGTFPLPESQLDRFLMKISIGYPSKEAEKEIIKGGSKREELYSLKPFITKEQILKIREEIQKVYVSDKMADYILDIVWATRESKYLESGLSTRGTLALVNSAKTNAFFEGRDFIIPEDIKKLYPYVITHRVIFKPEFESQKQEIIKWIVESVPIPL
ncbi:MAG TPA: MoxR family ATPase [Sulfurihydrogenibium azorense]|uniref:MoxR family ATPase n=1 Tax=Sulfurihydrogenibium azorense TaxID=309806 RepID=A0A832DQK8_9AQUI|nr:MAG: AAA family ATPase [Sulfurihydrogenibium sp.]HEV09229.1 MoxR family ATPase [Sulfurihydrogenibium azorense]